jgi:hypothetical protein
MIMRSVRTIMAFLQASGNKADIACSRNAKMPHGTPVLRTALAAIVFAVAWCLFAGAAFAANLQVPADAPAWQHVGAAALLIAHIGGGTVGMLSGAVSLILRKGSRAHRTAGTVFFGAMFITYAIGAGVAPFLTECQRPNFVAGILALYLLVTGWTAARNRNPRAGWPEGAGLVAALAIAVTGMVFMQMGASSPTGTIDGSPPGSFVLFAVAGTLGACGEANALLRRGLTGAARIARHLWRMCFSLFLASGSFFLGQMQFQPVWFRESAAPGLLAFLPLLVMMFWLVRVRIGRGGPARTAQA